MSSKPMQRSIKHLKDAGWQVAIVEKYIAAIKQKKDVWNFGDILACIGSDGLGSIALIQTTNDTHHAERKEKILTECADSLKRWKQAGGLVFVHSWGLRGPRGQRKTWTLREEQL